MRGREQRFGDRVVRAWKGSKRPPDIDPTIWNHFMSNKDKAEAIGKYEAQLQRERAELAAEAAERADAEAVRTRDLSGLGPPPGLAPQPVVESAAAPAAEPVGGEPPPGQAAEARCLNIAGCAFSR